jgi:hypothetical protein
MPNFYINFLNKTVKSLSILCDFAVAPFTGAWIKIKESSWYSAKIKSHPSRVRGLKLYRHCHAEYERKSHPSRVRGLKLVTYEVKL